MALRASTAISAATITYSCKARYFCSSCHQKRMLASGAWLEGNPLAPVPHRQYVFALPKLVRPFFRSCRRHPGALCRLIGGLLQMGFKARPRRERIDVTKLTAAETPTQRARDHMFKSIISSKLAIACPFHRSRPKGRAVADRTASPVARTVYIVQFIAAISGYLSGCAEPGFGRHADLVRADSSAAGIPSQPPEDGVRVTYLGTTSFLLQSRQGSILIDPYFSRVGPLLPLVLGRSITPDQRRIDEALDALPDKIDYIIVTHGHIDHLFDVPIVARRTGAKVILSCTGFYQASAAGLTREQMIVPHLGQPIGSGTLQVTAFLADHAPLLGVHWYAGTGCEQPKCIRHIWDWKAGQTLTYLIQMEGSRIFMSSGNAKLLPPESVAPVDLALLGVALKGSRDLFPLLVERIRPRVIQPTHQDDFARPLSDGFYYSRTADMDAVRQTWNRLAGSSELVLLDYYKPWILR